MSIQCDDTSRGEIFRDMTLAFLRMVHPTPMSQNDIRRAINFYIEEHGDLRAARNAIAADMHSMIQKTRLH